MWRPNSPPSSSRWSTASSAVFGESCGAQISALVAIRAGRVGLGLRAQVLVNPAVDVTGAVFAYASITEHAHTLTLALPPAPVVVPTHDPLAGHGRRYAERLREAGTSVRLAEHPEAPHAFPSLPGVVPQAEAARRRSSTSSAPVWGSPRRTAVRDRPGAL